MENKKKLLVLTSTFPRWVGDTEPPFVFELCNRLKSEFKIIVLAPHAKEAKFYEIMDGIEVIRFRYCFSSWEQLTYEGGILSNLKQKRWRYCLLPLFFISQLMALIRIINSHVDVIHAHWLIPQGLTAAFASLLVKKSPPILCTSHGGDMMGLNMYPLKKLKRWVIKRAGIVTVVSKAMVDQAFALSAKPESTKVIPMGVDTRDRFTPNFRITRKNNALLFVGRLVEKKGVIYLISALPTILKYFPDIRLDIVGDGPEKITLEKQVEELNLSHAVYFHGAKNNSEISALYHQATILIVPSVTTIQGDQEGLGLVLAEALACECPVVATDLPAIRDVVIHRTTGLLVSEKSATDISCAVMELLKQPELRESLAKTGRQYVQENFDWLTIATKYSNLLHILAH